MKTENTFLGTVVAHLVKCVEPLKVAISDEIEFNSLMLELGWWVPNFPTSQLSDINNAFDDLFANLNELNDDPDESDIIDILTDISTIYTKVKDTVSALGNSLSGLGSSQSTFVSEFPERVFELLMVKYLRRELPAVYSMFELLSIIQTEFIPESVDRPAYNHVKLDLGKIFDIVKNPEQLVRTSIGWNTSNFNLGFLIQSLFEFLASRGLLGMYRNTKFEERLLYNEAFSLDNTSEKSLDVSLFSALVGAEFKSFYIRLSDTISTNSIEDSGIILVFDLPLGFSLTQPISEELDLTINSLVNVGNKPALLITPGGIQFKLLNQNTNTDISLGLGLKYRPSSPSKIFGKSDGTRLQISEASASVTGISENNQIEIITELDLSGLEFIINPGDSDGFIKKVFGEGQKKLTLPIIISWSSKHGIRFKGSGAFEITVNPNKPLGPIVFNELTLALKAMENQPLKTQIGATISGKIGPISFIVENIGIELKFDKNEGNAGPFGIDIGFKPPNGVGLKVKASKLEGGGYLYIDRDKGRYAGGIELDIFGKLRVTAVGIITTKNPDGTPGFSLLIAVGVEFPGIPVGFGFTFNGVGVLAGVNRTMNPNALRAGVKGGAINSLMFPKNVIENIKTLITDMESYFPIEQKKYTFGVFFLLKWGVGVPLVSIKLGVIISFPQPVRLAIVGIIQIALPDPNVPVLKLNVAFVGIIDFENKYISFDASIYDSRLLFITLYGDMAVRLFWGERREMLVSVGGFHPAYNAPAYLMLPKMDRMTLSIFDEKNLRLIIETYFAVTSNTVQFGVKLDFLLKVWKLKILGWFGFDVLFQFNPFKFLSHVYAGLAVMWDDKELLCISLDFNLNGPGPWHAVGKGEFTVLGMKQSANFDETWGDEPDTSAPEIEVTPKLLDALNKDENWQGSLPEGRKTYVKLAVSGTGTLIMDPLGEFTITQKVLPFTINIERFGGQKVKDVGIYSLDLVKVNGVAITSPTSTKENFASAQFKEMNDNDKIKAPSFEFLPNGVKIGYDYSELMFGDFITKDIEYDVVLIDGENRTDINVLNTTIDINSFTKGGLISTNQISKKANRDIASPIDKVDFNQESYVLVSKDSLNTISTTSIGSLGNAYTERDKIYAKSPELKGMYEIIPA